MENIKDLANMCYRLSRFDKPLTINRKRANIELCRILLKGLFLENEMKHDLNAWANGEHAHQARRLLSGYNPECGTLLLSKECSSYNPLGMTIEDRVYSIEEVCRSGWILRPSDYL